MMIKLPNCPHIYEINLMTWLHDLSRRENQTITLNSIPKKEWRYLKDLGMDLVWLMGMWERSPDSRARARKEPDLIKGCKQILRDFVIDDIIGSPYAIHDFLPDRSFGSFEDLLDLKNILEEEGLGLVLDFVPNHTACDHPWITEHPGRYVQSSPTPAGCPNGFFSFKKEGSLKCFAHGKDPYFPPWSDTAQINYAHQDTIESMSETLKNLAKYCHGFRCDMAMLILKDIFRETWHQYLESSEELQEFWTVAIGRLRASGNQCKLMAEAYWGKEEPLLDCGFDYVYDKYLYDLMNEGHIEKIKEYISMPPEKQGKLVRFLENHDEERAVRTFGAKHIRCAMVIHATLPGMRLWHHGQFEGRQHKVPVQLRRAPNEDIESDLLLFSETLLKEVAHPVFHEGLFEICSTYGWTDNESHVNLLAWSWAVKNECRLVVVNFSPHSAQGYVRLSRGFLDMRRRLLLYDPFKRERFNYISDDIKGKGLYVGLGSGDFHFFIIEEE